MLYEPICHGIWFISFYIIYWCKWPLSCHLCWPCISFLDQGWWLLGNFAKNFQGIFPAFLWWAFILCYSYVGELSCLSFISLILVIYSLMFFGARALFSSGLWECACNFITELIPPWPLKGLNMLPLDQPEVSSHLIKTGNKKLHLFSCH